MDPTAVTYEQRPEPIPRSAYERARTEIVDTYRGLDGVEAIYETGTVADPGISDLDIKVIYEDEGQVETPSLDSISDIVDTLVGRGNVIKTPVTPFQKFKYIDPNRSPVHLSGRQLDIESPPESIVSYRDAAYVMDFLPERLYRVLMLQQQETIPVMRTLQMLKSVSYTSRIMDDLLSDYDGETFADEVKELRGTWFDQDDEKYARMLELIDEAVIVLATAGRRWFADTPDTILKNTRAEPGTISLLDDLVYTAGEQFEFETTDGPFAVQTTIPSWWFDHYRYYASRESLLGRTLRSASLGQIDSTGCLTDDYKAFLDTKYDLCNQAFSWSVEHNIGSALKFGFLLHRIGWDDETRTEFELGLEQVHRAE